MSVVSNERNNWLDEVKADAEAITKKRLEDELPQLEEEVKSRSSKKKVEPTQPLPGESDGQPDQGAIEEPTSGAKKVSK